MWRSSSAVGDSRNGNERNPLTSKKKRELALSFFGDRRIRRDIPRLLNQGVKPVEIHGFDQMIFKATLVAAADVFLHSETGKGNPKNPPLVFQLLNKIDATAIRQANVA